MSQNKITGNSMNRRGFLQKIGASSVFLGTQLGQVFPELNISDGELRYDRSKIPSQLSEGNLYGDILVLPHGSELPDFVIPPRHDTPIFCSAGVGRGGLEPEVSVITIALDNPRKLRNLTQKPVYTLIPKPKEYEQRSATLTIHENTGEIYSTTIGYQYEDETLGPTTGILITMYYDTYLPYPIWEPGELDNIFTPIQPVTYLPREGIVDQTADGVVFHWVEEEVLYSLYVEGPLGDQTPEDIAKTLKKAGGR